MNLKNKRSTLNTPRNAFFFIILAFLFWATFIVYPIIYSTGLSFFDWTGLTQTPFKDFVGLDNYARLLGDRVYLLALRNTAVFTLGTIILLNIFGFGIALFLFYGKLKGSIVWRSVIFFPCMLSSLSVGFNWRNILMQNGILNMILERIFPAYESFGWLMNATTPIFVLVFVSSWQWVGYNMIIYYAGLQNVRNELIESAKIDGASWRQIIFHMVIPQLKRVISLVVLLNIMGGFKVFDIVFGLTRGGPAHASETLTTYMYYQSFSVAGTNEMGYASVISVTLTLIVLFFAIIRVNLERRQAND